MKKKLTQIILPYFLISLSFLLIYPSLCWLIFTRLKVWDINDKIIGIYVPLAISSLLIWFFFRKRLYRLYMPDKRRKATLFLCWMLLIAPVVTFQYYLEQETAELTELKNVREIWTQQPTLYYSIENATKNKDLTGLYIARSSVGRGNERAIVCYFACPLTDNDGGTYNHQVWIGTTFGKKFSNRVFDDKERQARQMAQFIDSSKKRYEDYEYGTSYLKQRYASDEKSNYLRAIQNTGIPVDEDNIIILTEERGDFTSRAGSSLWWTICLIIVSNLTWFLSTISSKLKTKYR